MAMIKVDVDRISGTIDKRLFGGFAEHVGNVVYDGIFEPGSPLSDSDGFRIDVMDAIRDLRPATLRWPGGNFASAYDWSKAVGAERKPVVEPVWQSVWPKPEYNTFGTDEFVKYCKKVGAEPYICVNMGDGTQREAMQWVEYCNSTAGTEIADKRAKNGVAEPYGVKIWGLGNEICGEWQIGYKDANTYAAAALEYAKAMRLIDPSIELVAVGGIYMRLNFEQMERNWDRIVLEKLAGVVDHIGLHFYARKLPVSTDENVRYRQFMGEVEWLETDIQMLRGEIVKAEYHQPLKNKRPVRIAVDELGIWYKGFEQVYNLEDALVAAAMLNVLLNNADIVSMFNWAQVANIIGPLVTRKDDMFLQTIYHPLELYARLVSGNALDLFVDSPVFDTDVSGGLPLLHASAAHNPESNTVTVFVVNRDPEIDISADIVCQNGQWGREYEVHEINGPSLDAENSFDKKTVCTETKKLSFNSACDVFSYTFPAHSVTAITMTLE